MSVRVRPLLALALAISIVGRTRAQDCPDAGAPVDGSDVGLGLPMDPPIDVSQDPSTDPSAPADATAGDAPIVTYTVQSGDTLSGIASAYGLGLGDVIGANPEIADPNLIYPGELINLPGAAPWTPDAPAPDAPAPDAPAPVAPAGPSFGEVSNAEAVLAFGASNPINADTGDRTWYLWCLGFVNQAELFAGNYVPELQAVNAHQAFVQFANEGRVQQGPAPRGALVFYDYYDFAGVNEGHIGISNGDGTYQSTVADNGWGGQIDLARPIGWGSIGWVDPTVP